MANFTIDISNEKLCAALREQAEQNSRSVEEEIIMIVRSDFPQLQEPQSEDGSEKGLGTAIHELFAQIGGVEPEELDILPRAPGRKPPNF
ncbi:MAG: plasmid stabilization protein [Betaproteobacteria bacterium]|nr:plasmid stabilization protein [Betaproteobacteria bacterium]